MSHLVPKFLNLGEMPSSLPNFQVLVTSFMEGILLGFVCLVNFYFVLWDSSSLNHHLGEYYFIFSKYLTSKSKIMVYHGLS